MKPEEIKLIKFESYTPEQIQSLKQTKNRIQKIIKKYIPNDEDGIMPIWDELNNMQEDVIHVMSLLSFISPLIGYLDGLSYSADDIKKLAMAKVATAVAAEATQDTEAPKKVTAKTQENIARAASEDIITSNMNMIAMAKEYKTFQYQTNEWVKTIGYRIKILHGELTDGKKFN